MKSVIILALISISFCGFITQEEVDELRSFAPFEVYDADENPFKGYTKEQIRDLFQVQPSILWFLLGLLRCGCFPAENLHQERRRNCPIPARLSLMR